MLKYMFPGFVREMQPRLFMSSGRITERET
jgi:hypothetical protein